MRIDFSKFLRILYTEKTKFNPINDIRQILNGFHETNERGRYINREELIRILTRCGERMAREEVEYALRRIGFEYEKIPVEEFIININAKTSMAMHP